MVGVEASGGCVYLSVIVVSFNMTRELPRTIRSLSPALQKGIAAGDYEIIVVDNGSRVPPRLEELTALAPNLRVLPAEAPCSVSPVRAINRALQAASGRLVGVWIDGARIASPGLLAAALQASRVADRPVIGTLTFHLGPDVQMKSVLNGYGPDVEDAMLRDAAWEDDPYRLFQISAFAGSSADGWFILPAETNALFLPREHWTAIGGYDPAFEQPGGGLANLDLWARVCEDASASVIMLLGEATFHQVHGGVATNAPTSPWEAFHAEYVKIRGKSFERPLVQPIYFGRLHPYMRASLRQSVDRLTMTATT